MSRMPRPYRCDRGAAEVRRTSVRQPSCTSLISRAFSALWPGGPEISFCPTIDHCRAILLFLFLGSRRRRCKLSTLLYTPGGCTGPRILTEDQFDYIKILLSKYELTIGSPWEGRS